MYLKNSEEELQPIRPDLDRLVPKIRYLRDMKEVLYNKSLEVKGDSPVYYMYRNLKLKEFGSGEFLRYDITVIPPGRMGEEYVKTKGHYHPSRYGELYIVLKGRALYLLQGRDFHDVVSIEAKRGDVVIIPPEYGHITINHGENVLEMANWVSPDFESLYDPLKEKEGGIFFYTVRGWIKNPNYNTPLSEPRSEEPKKELPGNLDFLFGKKENDR